MEISQIRRLLFKHQHRVKASPLPGVLVVEFDLPHDRGVVPVAEDDEGESIVHIPPQLGDFFRKILLLTVHHEQRAYRVRAAKTEKS